jgi:hypothetical protein
LVYVVSASAVPEESLPEADEVTGVVAPPPTQIMMAATKSPERVSEALADTVKSATLELKNVPDWSRAPTPENSRSWASSNAPPEVNTGAASFALHPARYHNARQLKAAPA